MAKYKKWSSISSSQAPVDSDHLPLEGTGAPKNDPFKYGRKKISGAYKEGVNSVTGIPDGSNPEELDKYMEYILSGKMRRDQELVAAQNGKKKKRRKKKLTKTPLTVSKMPHAAKKVTEVTQIDILQAKLDELHKKSRESMAERLRNRKKSK